MRQMITHIGAVALDAPLWWNDFNTSDYFLEDVHETIDGGFVTFRMAKKDKMITLTSDGTQRQSATVKDAILTLSRTGNATTLTDYDANTYDVEFVHTDGNAVVATPAYAAREAELWDLTIKMRTY